VGRFSLASFVHSLAWLLRCDSIISRFSSSGESFGRSIVKLISIVVAPKNFGSRLILTVAAAAITIFLLITNYKIVDFPFWLLGVAVRLMPSPIVRSKSISWTIVAVFTLSCKFSLSYFLNASDIVLQSTSDALLACAFANLLLTSMYSQNVPNESGARINLYLAGFSFSLYVVHAPALHLVLTMIKGESNPQLDF
jgi:hypothetical protein